MRQHKVKETPPNPKSFMKRFHRPHGEKRHIDYMKYLYTAALLFTFLACSVQPVMAANVWDKAKEIMKDVYNLDCSDLYHSADRCDRICRIAHDELLQIRQDRG